MSKSSRDRDSADYPQFRKRYDQIDFSKKDKSKKVKVKDKGITNDDRK